MRLRFSSLIDQAVTVNQNQVHQFTFKIELVRSAISKAFGYNAY